MESGIKKSPQLGYPADVSDEKYVSGLSTILVATIQEAKDRISQIEYIFCSQLYPNFQLKSNSLQKIYSEARQAAEDAWREKEKDLFLQIKKLELENQQVLEENQSLKIEKAKFENMKDLSPRLFTELQEELKRKTDELNEGREVQQNLRKIVDSKSSLILSYKDTVHELEERALLFENKQRNLERESEELRLELIKKSKEVDEGMELQNKLLQINQSKASVLLHKEMQLKEHGEKEKELVSKFDVMEKQFSKLHEVLKQKSEEVDKFRELESNLLKKLDSQASELMENELLLSRCDMEKRQLEVKTGSLVKRVDELQKEVELKNHELKEGRTMHEKLLQQIEAYNSERLKREQDLGEREKENKQLCARLRVLEETVNKLQLDLCARSKESTEGMELDRKLLHEIEAKNAELASERNKYKYVSALYKRLKHQHLYLLNKCGPNPEDIPPCNKIEDECEALKQNHTTVTSCDAGDKVASASGMAGELSQPKSETQGSEDARGFVFIQRPNCVSPSTSGAFTAPKCPTSVKSCPPAGTKRSNSYWRDTRSHQSRAGRDPHDDFLDTPLENARGNLMKVMKEDTINLPDPVNKNVHHDDTDDETQDMNIDPGPAKQCMPPPKVGTSNFKYVEPVRKKSERESLKGIECKQCKKFYDAVLPGEGKNPDGTKQIRCEHHDGVSRHRYRYAPPLTPEGFWNIGFESET